MNIKRVAVVALLAVGSACASSPDDAQPDEQSDVTAESTPASAADETASETIASADTQPSDATASAATTAANDTSTTTTTTIASDDDTPESTDLPEPAAPVQFVEQSVEITDDVVGPLTFDVRTIGDPAAADAGRAVVLLHGFPETNRSWDAVGQALADSGYYAVAINQRGYSAGARPLEVEHYAATHLVNDVYAIADELELDSFHVVGHDWGSLVAWSVAGREMLEQTGRVTSLTAMSVGHPLAFTAARNNETGDQAQRSAYMETFSAPDADQLFLADDAAFYRSLFSGAGYSDGELDAYLDVLGDPAAMTAALNWYRAIGLVALESAQPIDLPTLFIWSTGDIALGREQAELTKNFVTGTYTFLEIPDASHWVVHEEPDLVIDAVVAHLDAVG